MTKDDAVRHYGTVLALANALGISRQAIYMWGASVPEKHQYKLQVLTGGKLIAASHKKTA